MMMMIDEPKETLHEKALSDEDDSVWKVMFCNKEGKAMCPIQRKVN